MSIAPALLLPPAYMALRRKSLSPEEENSGGYAMVHYEAKLVVVAAPPLFKRYSNSTRLSAPGPAAMLPSVASAAPLRSGCYQHPVASMLAALRQHLSARCAGAVPFVAIRETRRRCATQKKHAQCHPEGASALPCFRQVPRCQALCQYTYASAAGALCCRYACGCRRPPPAPLVPLPQRRHATATCHIHAASARSCRRCCQNPEPAAAMLPPRAEEPLKKARRPRTRWLQAPFYATIRALRRRTRPLACWSAHTAPR